VLQSRDDFESDKELHTPDILIEDLIDSRVGVHDRTNFEVKLDYTIDPNRENRYRVESYFFIPKSLGINKATYDADKFYSDVRAYIRFKTPTLSGDDLVEDGSPFARARELIRQSVELGRSEDMRDQLSHELRLFGCIVRAGLRDTVNDFRERLKLIKKNADREVTVADLAVSCSRFADRIDKLLGSWRELRAEVYETNFPRQMRETYQFVDEFLSLELETRLSRLLGSIDKCKAANGLFADSRARFRDLIVAERRYRRGAGYRVVDSDSDFFVYRKGKLKKFVMSVLWLEVAKEKEGNKLVNMGAAIAAGVAMLFAILATIAQTKRWAIDTSEFVVAAVITYMLKDRIKDWLKNFFSKRLTRFLFDYSVTVRDPVSDEALGRCREALNYIDIDDVPKSVLALRRRDARVSIEAEAKPEQVIRYEKEVRLDGQAAVDRLGAGQFDINDIMRFSLARFLQRADDPVTSVPLLDEESDQVVSVPFRKLYHLNLILVLRSATHDLETLKRIRVVFDKDTIRRLDVVS
jgi:hypothetical protein